MKNGYNASVRALAVGLALATYALLLHHASSLPQEQGALSATIALLPYFVGAAVIAWRTRHRYGWLLLIAGMGGLIWCFLAPIGDHADWVYFIQHVGGNAIMALIFGSSLLGSRVPLCARIAAVSYGPLEPGIARYTRRVTLAWTVFFAGTACISILLFAYAPIQFWSIFANLLAIPLVALMFAVEYSVRLRLLPDIKHVSVLEGIRLYFRAAHPSPPHSE